MMNDENHPMDQGEAANVMQDLIARGALQSPQQLRNALQQRALQTDQALKMLPVIYGQPVMPNVGDALRPGVQASTLSGGGQQNPGGVTFGGAGIPLGMSPSDQTAPTQIGVDPRTQAPIMGTRNQFVAQATGAAPGAPPVQPGAQAGTASGRYYPNLPPALRGPNAMAASAAAAPALPAAPGAGPQTAPGGGIIMGGGPAAAANITANTAPNAAQVAALTGAANDSVNRQATLAELGQNIDKFASGPNADWSLVAKAGLNRLSPSGQWPFDPQAIASQEAFRKQSQQLINQQVSTLGAGSDAQLAAAAGANLSDHISNMGVHEILPILQGNEAGIQAKNQAWQQARAADPAADFQQFSQNFNKKFDPRVYAGLYMQQPQWNAMVNSLSGPDRAHFKAAFNDYVKQNGAPPLPQQAAPAPAAPPALPGPPGPNGA
jgi:hypothetical protein